MALSKAILTAIPFSTSVAASGAVRGIIDVRTYDGGVLHLNIRNTGTGPTAQCVGKIYTAIVTTSAPTTGSAGVDWKLLYQIGGGTTASAQTNTYFEFGPWGTHLQVEFTDHTAQPVIVEAHAIAYQYS